MQRFTLYVQTLASPVRLASADGAALHLFILFHVLCMVLAPLLTVWGATAKGRGRRARPLLRGRAAGGVQRTPRGDLLHRVLHAKDPDGPPGTPLHCFLTESLLLIKVARMNPDHDRALVLTIVESAHRLSVRTFLFVSSSEQAPGC